jgi:TonB family protein
MLEGLRISGVKNIVPDDVTKVEIQRSGKTKIIGSFKLCIDANGAVLSVAQLKSTGFSAYDTKIKTAMQAWRYKPYTVNGKPVPVCTAVTFIYSQVDPEPATKIAPAVLERLRIAGDTNIQPDDQTVEEMVRRKLTKLVGNYHVCISHSGAVTHARTVTSTGFPHYDDSVISTIKQWEHKPHVVNGSPTAGCSIATVTFRK